METKPSTRRDHAVKLVYVQIESYTYCFVTKIVNKGYRSRNTNNFNVTQGVDTNNGIAFLINEISIRTQLDIPGLCKLMAVRDSENFTFLCSCLISCHDYVVEELCDMGVVMVNNDGVYAREKRTLELPTIISSIRRTQNAQVDSDNKTNSVYSEAEARFIMWHVFRTIQERLHVPILSRVVHNSQICHLDIRPDNIYLTSRGYIR